MAPCDTRDRIRDLQLERDLASDREHAAQVRLQTLLVRIRNVAECLNSGCSPTHAAEELLEISKESWNG